MIIERHYGARGACFELHLACIYEAVLWVFEQII